ncbi:MAG: hypothetical protein J7496_11230 [Novosphingobium sp.]|nr:hypothetical protein [Novosphingobium sp.]
MNAAGRLLATLACLLSAGCISTEIDEIPPSFETVRLLREQDIPPLALGEFVSGPNAPGRSVTIRGSDMHAAKGSNFAQFLGANFESELKAAGKLDPGSPLRLSGVLTESHAGENLSSGKAWLAAEISLSRNGRTIFTRPYRADSQWKSDFIGAIAIPDAFREYNALYALLVRQALGDPDFIAAAKSGRAPSL